MPHSTGRHYDFQVRPCFAHDGNKVLREAVKGKISFFIAAWINSNYFDCRNLET